MGKIKQTVKTTRTKYRKSKSHKRCSKCGIVYDSFDCRERQAEYCWITK